MRLRRLGFLALGLLVACSHAAAPDDTLRAAFSTEPHSLNPIAMQNGQEMVIDRLFSDPLTSFDPTGNRIVPILALRVPSRDNGDVSADGKTIVFHLRRGVKWQDGAPFTSADVAYTFAQVMNPANDVVSRFGYDDVESLETPDPYTVRLRLKHAYSPIVSTFFGDANVPFGILPRHLLRALRVTQHGSVQRASGRNRTLSRHGVASRRSHRARREPRVLPRAAAYRAHRDSVHARRADVADDGEHATRSTGPRS